MKIQNIEYQLYKCSKIRVKSHNIINLLYKLIKKIKLLKLKIEVNILSIKN